MQSTLKPENPFNFIYFIGEHESTLQVEDFIYMLS